MGKIYEDINSIDDDVKDMKEKDANDFIERASEIMAQMTTYVSPKEDVMYRDEDIERILDKLTKRDSSAVIIVGDKGIGKNTVIRGLSYRLQKSAEQSMICTLNLESIIYSVSQPIETKQKLAELFNSAVDTGVDFILHIENIGHLLHQGCYGNVGFSILNNLINFIENSSVKVIATATNDEMKEINSNFKHLLDYFTVYKLDELNKEQSTEILKARAKYYHKWHDVTLPKGAIEKIADTADAHIKDECFPYKAISLYDEVCAHIYNKHSKNDVFLTFDKKMSEYSNQMKKAVSSGDFAECEKISTSINELTDEMNKIAESIGNVKATNDEINEALSSILKISAAKLDSNNIEFLKEMPVQLKKDVIGQDETIDKVVRNIRRNKLGLRKTAHTLGNFMFIGPTGVGKTHLAKQLAKYLYGSEENFLRFDMSEYQGEIDVTRLLGSSPGYVGFKESGTLVKGLSKKSETILLFDEIEKANPKIFDVLLQLMDEGFVTGGDGKKYDARQCLVILTSNIGVKKAKEMSKPLGFVTEDKSAAQAKNEKTIIEKSLKKRFSPEFINRLDNICYFNSLDRGTLTDILVKELKEMNVNIKEVTGKTITLDKDLKEWMIDKVVKENNGARPIIRLLQQKIEEEITDMVIDDSPVLNTKKKTLVATLNGEDIEIS